jgi:hypothetical protein
MEIEDASTSAIYGPQKFETKNWVSAKLSPVTSATGQFRRNPLPPETTRIKYAGSSSESTGTCLPAIAESLARSSPVTPERAIIGMPSAPKATGAVLAISAVSTARRAGCPRPTSRQAVTATGAPKPAVPSSSAPKQNATSTTWMLASPEACCSIQRRKRSNFPVSCVRL